MLAFIAPAVLALASFTAAPKDTWKQLFDGKTLKGWSPKIVGHAFGDNFANTFRVVDKVVQVNYDGYDGKFDGRFGHLFYKSPFKSYVFRCEYRFTGSQLPDAPGWALRNSGIMILCQNPKTIGKDQDFPVSIEVQLLGGNGKDERHTGNVCTPGTNIVHSNQLWTQHCTDSTSPTFHGDVWVKAEVEVQQITGTRRRGTFARANLEPGQKPYSLSVPYLHIVHRINGEKVIEYDAPQLDPNDADAKPLIAAAKGELMLNRGWISLQSESHPCEFRKIEIKELR